MQWRQAPYPTPVNDNKWGKARSHHLRLAATLNLYHAVVPTQ